MQDIINHLGDYFYEDIKNLPPTPLRKQIQEICEYKDGKKHGVRKLYEELGGIIRKENNQLIGGTNITHKGEIGCWIGRRYWNQGFATETIERIKKFGFEELKLEKMWAATHKDNETVFTLMEKTGFSRVKDRPYYVEGVGDTKVRPHFELTK